MTQINAALLQSALLGLGLTGQNNEFLYYRENVPVTILHNTSSIHAIPAFGAELMRARLRLLHDTARRELNGLTNNIQIFKG